MASIGREPGGSEETPTPTRPQATPKASEELTEVSAGVGDEQTDDSVLEAVRAAGEGWWKLPNFYGRNWPEHIASVFMDLFDEGAGEVFISEHPDGWAISLGPQPRNGFGVRYMGPQAEVNGRRRSTILKFKIEDGIRTSLGGHTGFGRDDLLQGFGALYYPKKPFAYMGHRAGHDDDDYI